MLDPDFRAFPGGQRYGDYHDEVLDAPYVTSRYVKDHRGRRTVHAGKRTYDGLMEDLALGAGAGGVLGAFLGAPALRTGTVAEFVSNEHLADMAMGGLKGAAIGAAGMYLANRVSNRRNNG